MTAVPAQPPAVPDELASKAATAYNRAAAAGEWGLGAALAAVADYLRAEARQECAAEVEPVIAQLYEIECYGPAGTTGSPH